MMNYFKLLFSWWEETTIGTMVHTLRHGTFVGKDAFGNKYYKQDVSNNQSYAGNRKGERRWVIYANKADASAIPAGWHGWMHYRTDEVPGEDGYEPHEWERVHQPNRTGSAHAHHPPGSILTPDSRPKVSGDYEPWTP